MSQKKIGVVSDQMKFFNDNAAMEKPVLSAPLFVEYANKEQKDGFTWLADRQRILDYGCGTGTSMESFLAINPRSKTVFVGVDIADVAIQKIKQTYPGSTFYTIQDNKIPQLQTGDVDGAYLLHVLHHSKEHQAIFREIYAKLDKGGKFFLSDLSSNNLIVRFFRSIFILSPDFVKRRFLDDLVVEEGIPEKYKVYPEEIIKTLKEIGFKVEEVGYGHLAFFLIAWFDRFANLSGSSFFRIMYTWLWRIENRALKYRLFQKQAEVFYIKCVK